MRASAYPRGFETEDDLPEVTVSRLKGDFRGWTGRTRLELLNGQEWEQRSFGHMYRYACVPRVAIVQRDDGHWMRVEGVPGWMPVRKVK